MSIISTPKKQADKMKIEIAESRSLIRKEILSLLTNDPNNWIINPEDNTEIMTNDGRIRIDYRGSWGIMKPVRMKLRIFLTEDRKILRLVREIKKKIELSNRLDVYIRAKKILMNPLNVLLVLEEDFNHTSSEKNNEFEIEFEIRGYQTFQRYNPKKLLYFTDSNMAMAFKLKWM